MSALQPPFIAAMIVPTGVGASIGGFAGDATPAMNLLASVTDVLITHPNVANAAVFQQLPENALYTEGYGLDQFLRGRWALRPVRSHRVGVVFDARIPADMLTLHLNTLNAVRSVYGVDILGYTLTENPVETGCEMMSSGCSSGYLRNPVVILNACRRLQAAGATAIALCVLLPELAENEETLEARYRSGSGVDPIGGVEGILSHLVVSELGVPCAHVPVFPWDKARPVTDALLDPRTAAEFIAPTFMPCVLTGLRRAPDMILRSESKPGDYTVDQLAALVAPANALGGIPVFSALQRNIPVLAVESNRTVLSMDRAALAALPARQRALIQPVRSYAEAAGVLQALRLGLHLSDGQPVPEIAAPLSQVAL